MIWRQYNEKATYKKGTVTVINAMQSLYIFGEH